MEQTVSNPFIEKRNKKLDDGDLVVASSNGLLSVGIDHRNVNSDTYCINAPGGVIIGEELLDDKISESPLYSFLVDKILEPHQIEELVSYVPNTIQYIAEPSYDLQVTAVSQRPDSIRFIERPFESVEIMVLDKDPDNLKHIKNASMPAIKYALNKKGSTILHVDNPSEELQLIAGVDNIAHIKGVVCKPLQLQAVSEDEYAIYKFKQTFPEVVRLQELKWEL